MKLYPMYHRCGNIAFYTIRKIEIGDDMDASDVYKLDGTQPVNMVDTIKCYSCGEVNYGNVVSDLDFYYKSLEPIEVIFDDSIS